MNFKKIGIVLFLIFSLFPINKTLAQDSSIGFVPGDIWLSKNSLEEGDQIRIYTAIFNPDNRELSGTFSFFDNNVLLGKKNFIIPPYGVKDISIIWTVGIGDHNIFGRIEKAKYLISEGKYEEIKLLENETNKISKVVNKKITQKISEAGETLFEKSVNSINNIGKLVEEKIPNTIAKPAVFTVDILEEFREKIGDTSKNKKEEVKKELEILKDEKIGKEQPKEKTNKLTKPFNYVKLFGLSLVSFVFNNKFIFYGFLFLSVFFLLRFIWRLIF